MALHESMHPAGGCGSTPAATSPSPHPGRGPSFNVTYPPLPYGLLRRARWWVGVVLLLLVAAPLMWFASALMSSTSAPSGGGR